MESRYAKNASAVYLLNYHLVWCSKYRRPVLTDIVGRRLEELFRAKCEEIGLTIHALEVMPDHVHIFVGSDPTRSVAEIVNRLKGFTSNVMRKEFKVLRTRIPTLWTRSYYAGTTGEMSSDVVLRYIEGQKGR